MLNPNNKIHNLLINLNLIDETALVKYSEFVRDRKDIYAIKCETSGIIFLSEDKHIKHYYEKKQDTPYWGEIDYERAKYFNYTDDVRRGERYKDLIANKKWCDFGTGAGGILSLYSNIAQEAVGVELQEAARIFLCNQGFLCHKDINEFDHEFDLITLFHVFEHLSDPIETLKNIKNKLSKDGKLIIEVPHAKDVLLNLYNSESFKNFTLWSEHLILHTRSSLRKFLEKAGFQNIIIEGIQRYPLSNHLYWLTKESPGGHKKWNFLNQNELVTEYQKTLASLDMTDTLIATAIN